MIAVKSLIRVAWVSAVLGSSSLCWAGGHSGAAGAFHRGGHGPVRFFGGGISHISGTPHVSRNAFPRFAHHAYRGRPEVYGARFGHANTAYVARPARFPGMGGFARGSFHAGGLARPRFGYGRRGFVRYALAPHALDRNRRVLRGFAGPGFYSYGETLGYGLGSGALYGYAEPPLAATYAEPPLGPSPYGDDDRLSFDAYGSGYDGYSGYGGGPRIISVRSEDRLRPAGCSCGRESRQGPVVYRFGIGSYY